MAIRKQRTELLVGLFVFFGLAIMGTLILQFGRVADQWQPKYELVVEFPTAAGLRKGSPVKLGGQKVGYVSAQPTHNEDFSAESVTLAIYEEKKIPLGSKFKIGTSGLMGDTFVDIAVTENFTGEFFQDGTEIEGTTAAGLDQLQNSAGQVLEDVQVAVKSLNRVLEKIEKEILGTENIENIEGTLADLKASSANIKSTTEKLDPVVEEVKGTIAEAKVAVEKAGTTFDTATETLEGIKETVSKADPALENLEPTVEELKALLANANSMIDEIKSGSGPAAALINDSELRDDLASFADKLDRYGILGYPKDKSKPDASSPGTGSSAPAASSPRKRATSVPRRK